MKRFEFNNKYYGKFIICKDVIRREVKWFNGKLHGKYIHYYENNVYETLYFKNGKEEGNDIRYDYILSNCGYFTIINYKNGIEIGREKKDI
jgi:hypothetical protein